MARRQGPAALLALLLSVAAAAGPRTREGSRSVELRDLDRPDKLDHFAAWCRATIGEDADFCDPGVWEREWFTRCWRELIGPDSDVHFGE